MEVSALVISKMVPPNYSMSSPLMLITFSSLGLNLLHDRVTKS